MSHERKRSAIREVIKRVVRDLPFSMRQIAEEAGVSYDAVRSWAAERRVPRPENLTHLAPAIEARSISMQQVASELRMLVSEDCADRENRTDIRRTPDDEL